MQSIFKCRMTRLSFGLLCTQNAALFCLENSLFENVTCASEATILKTLISFYVDDGLLRFSSEEALIKFFREVVPPLNSCGFPLTKCFTNNDRLKS